MPGGRMPGEPEMKGDLAVRPNGWAKLRAPVEGGRWGEEPPTGEVGMEMGEEEGGSLGLGWPTTRGEEPGEVAGCLTDRSLARAWSGPGDVFSDLGSSRDRPLAPSAFSWLTSPYRERERERERVSESE